MPPTNLAQLNFGPPLLPGEKKHDYLQILQWVTDAVQPQDMIEKFYVKDITDATVETERYKYLSALLVKDRWQYEIRYAIAAKLAPTNIWNFIVEIETIITPKLKIRDHDEVYRKLPDSTA